MRTEYLQYLLEVSRLGTISQAAERLYLRQSTLSAIIRTIEDEVGVQIFSRSRRGVVPTPEGEKVLAFAETVIHSSDQLRETLSSKNTTRRTVNLVAYHGACEFLGPILAESLAKKTEDVSFVLHETGIRKILSQFYDGVSKIAIGADDETFISGYQALDHTYVFEKLYDDYIYLVVGENSPYAERSTISFDEVTDEHLAFGQFYPSANDVYTGYILKHFSHISVFGSYATLKKAVMNHNMIAIMPGLSMFNDIYSSLGKLRCVKLDGFTMNITNFVIHATKLCAVETFLLEEIRRVYKELPEMLFG